VGSKKFYSETGKITYALVIASVRFATISRLAKLLYPQHTPLDNIFHSTEGLDRIGEWAAN
jgi:hypothetical protein